MRNSFIATVAEECGRRNDIFILSGDAGLGVFDRVREDIPERYLNLGVAEQNMASFAAGLSLTGFRVYLYNIIPFLLYRCYEQVRNDICGQGLPVVLIGTGSGLTYAPAGVSHYSVEDIGIARTLPNLTIISPADPVEARAAALYSFTSEEPLYVRLAKRGEQRIHPRDDIDITEPQLIQDGTGIALVFHGSVSTEVMNACQDLGRHKIYPKVISVPMLQPLNSEGLLALLHDVKAVVTIEEHFENSGLGAILKCIHAERHPPWEVRTMGIPFMFIPDVLDQGGLRKRLGISAGAVSETVQELMNERQ